MAVLSFDDLVPGTGSKKTGGALDFSDITPATKAAPEGFFQQKGGLADYLPAGVTSAMQRLDDLTQSAGDVVTRGFGSNDAMTETARQRAGWATLPGDVAAAVVSAPYRIGSAMAGAGLGALEGAASTYGHQKDWVPDLQGALDIAKGAGVGAVTGGLGAKAGEWIGRGWNRLVHGAPPPVPPPPGATPQLSKVGAAVHAAGNVPLSTTAPIDYVLAQAGIPPLVSGTTKTARLIRPLFKPQLPSGAPPPEPASAAAMRDFMAKAMAAYGRSP